MTILLWLCNLFSKIVGRAVNSATSLLESSPYQMDAVQKDHLAELAVFKKTSRPVQQPDSQNAFSGRDLEDWDDEDL